MRRPDPQTLAGYLGRRGVTADALHPEGDLALLERLPEIFPFSR